MPRTTFEGTVTYNGFTAPFSRLDVETQVLYAEDKTTQIGVAYTFNISGFLCGSTRTAFATKLAQMRTAWERPRGDFVVLSGSLNLFGFTQTVGSVQPLPGTPGYKALVEDWGPMPSSLRFSRFAAGMACSYSCSITCTTKECLAGGSCADILSISQTWVHVVDMNGLTTRVTSGRLLVGRTAANADAYRWYVVPQLPLYYKRESENFSQSEDGRELMFSITDTEQVWTLPVPLTEGQASLQVHIEPSGIVQYSLSGTFGAPVSVSKATILQRINSLMIAKIPGITIAPGQPGFAWVEAFDFTDHIYANRIDFSIRVKVPVDGTGKLYDTAVAAFQTFIVAPPNSDGNTAIPGAYGGYGAITSGIIAPPHTDYDACSVGPTGEEGTPTGGTSTMANSRSVVPASITTSSYGGISDDHLRAPFLAYHEEISYEFDNGFVSLQPKKHGIAPVIQQTRAPQLKMIQAGYCIRAASLASQRPIPARPMLPGGSVLLQSYVSPASEEVVDPTWSKWTVSWRYIMQYAYAISDSNNLPVEEMYRPANPIRPFTSWADLPFSTSTNLVSVQE